MTNEIIVERLYDFKHLTCQYHFSPSTGDRYLVTDMDHNTKWLDDRKKAISLFKRNKSKYLKFLKEKNQI